MYTLKKSMGQHFLKDENICRKIVEELKKCSFKNLLEAGPGGGALTKYLIQISDVNNFSRRLPLEHIKSIKAKSGLTEKMIIQQRVLAQYYFHYDELQEHSFSSKRIREDSMARFTESFINQLSKHHSFG